MDKDRYFLKLAEDVSKAGTCLRRFVGCVLTNGHGHIIGTGYNGRPRGMKHCNELLVEGVPGAYYTAGFPKGYVNACEGATLPSGQGLDLCEAVHAEANALLQCKNVEEIHTCYVTHSPCINCVKLLMNTSCERVVFTHRYAHDEASSRLWTSIKGESWWHIQFP